MIRRVGRPGLIGTMARTAVISGTASAVNRSVNRRMSAREQERAESQAYQQQSYQAPPPPPSAAAAAPGGDDMIAKIKQLSDLHSAGALSDAEFAAAKAKLLSLGRRAAFRPDRRPPWPVFTRSVSRTGNADQPRSGDLKSPSDHSKFP
ncbi:SHOCT domain-containing protein [Salininema proteolyticum]|uniref:SHOCT domain-containing protein n=1 Tax=Salininema proteolyticum TaxID=1607685 RepID=A0ABV8U629_9ACTN